MDPKQRPAAGKDLRPMVKLVDDNGEELNIADTDVPARYFLPGRGDRHGDGAKSVSATSWRVSRRSLEDARHHRWSAACRRPVRGAQAEGAGDPRGGDGTVSFGKETKGKQRLVITPTDDGETKSR
jgi:DNA-directed RNA polymerase subunit beta'